MTGYQRDDGLWDIEGRLTDTRAYDSSSIERGPIAAGQSVHDMLVCVTVDSQLVVVAAVASMLTHPYANCTGALPPVGILVGATLGPGWRRRIDEALGGELGCTHIREMLLQIATTAYQTIPVWFAQQSGDVMHVTDGKPPRHLGQCHAWSFSGPVVARVYPQFSKD